MNIGAMAILPVMALVLASLAPAEAARPSSTVDRTRQSRVRAAVRIHADTLVQQTLVAIRKDTQDGQWLVASAGPLLDNFRGADSNVTLPDTVMKAIRTIAADAGLTVTDTLALHFGRRILRADLLERYRVEGLIRQSVSGSWVVDETLAEERSLDAEFARIRLEEESADRQALIAEIERQEAAKRPRRWWFGNR